MGLMAGAASSAVKFDGILPMEGFTEVHDDLKVRILILEANERTVIASMDMTSLPSEVHEKMIELVSEVTGASRENVWLTLTHAFASPHIFPKPEPGKPHRGPKLSPEDIEKTDLLRDSFERALTQAGKNALERMKPVSIGAGKGKSLVSISRNMMTGKGWTLGADADEYLYRGLGVIRIDSEDGKPEAVVYNFGVRSAVMSFARTEAGGKVISGDLCENACDVLEKELGCTALFLCGGCADSDPMAASKNTYIDAEGNACESTRSLEESAAILKALSERLACDVLKVWGRIKTDRNPGSIGSRRKEMVYQIKDASPSANVEDLVVTDSFTACGEGKMDVYAMNIGNIVLGGVSPEMDSIIAEIIIDSGADMAVCMVNGSGKSMPFCGAYEKKQYGAFHSPYMPGTGEKAAEVVAELIS